MGGRQRDFPPSVLHCFPPSVLPCGRIPFHLAQELSAPFPLSLTSRLHSRTTFAVDRGVRAAAAGSTRSHARVHYRQAVWRASQVRALEAIRRAAADGGGRVGRAVDADPLVSGRFLRPVRTVRAGSGGIVRPNGWAARKVSQSDSPHRLPNLDSLTGRTRPTQTGRLRPTGDGCAATAPPAGSMEPCESMRTPQWRAHHLMQRSSKKIYTRTHARLMRLQAHKHA